MAMLESFCSQPRRADDSEMCVSCPRMLIGIHRSDLDERTLEAREMRQTFLIGIELPRDRA